MIDNQYIIECIWRDLVSRGNTVSRTSCGNFIVINGGMNCRYYDLKRFLRLYRLTIALQSAN